MEVLTMVLMSDRVDENSTLKSLVAKHLESRADNLHMITELRHFCRREIAELKLYFQKEPCEVSINSLLVSDHCFSNSVRNLKTESPFGSL